MIRTSTFFLVVYAVFAYGVSYAFGDSGLWGEIWSGWGFLKWVAYGCIMAHLTITAMSLSFHRAHTHKGVTFNKWIDGAMQVWLWLVTSMSKPDWVSVHTYHHAYSDTPKDPHSPVQKGFWHVFLLGVFDYSNAKSHPDVLKIRKTIKLNPLEKFMSEHLFLGPVMLSAALMIFFGVKWGTILALTNFMISPIFAVGGVNAIAHTWGYRNHVSGDNSRNIGFLFPLNFIICGELDHNNHHAHQRSCSFRHQWYEFDIGWAYIWLLSKVRLATIRHVYSPTTLKEELSAKVAALAEVDARFRKRCEELAHEFNTSKQELLVQMQEYVQGKRTSLDRRAKELVDEIKRTVHRNELLGLKYA